VGIFNFRGVNGAAFKIESWSRRFAYVYWLLYVTVHVLFLIIMIMLLV
jgi:hypothetical protein